MSKKFSACQDLMSNIWKYEMNHHVWWVYVYSNKWNVLKCITNMFYMNQLVRKCHNCEMYRISPDFHCLFLYISKVAATVTSCNNNYLWVRDQKGEDEGERGSRGDEMAVGRRREKNNQRWCAIDLVTGCAGSSFTAVSVIRWLVVCVSSLL